MKEKTPFPARTKARSFGIALQSLIKVLYTQRVYTIMNPRNVEHFHHGINWRTHSGDESAKEISTMKQHQVQHTLRFDEITQHKLELIPSMIDNILNEMHAQLMGALYTTLDASTAKSGNIVNAAQQGSNQEAFLEMLKKIELGTNENGEVSMPEVHLGPGNPLLEDLKRAGPDFEAKVDAIIKEKSAVALQRERDRLSKFKG